MLHVSVISPEAMLFEGDAQSVVAPAFDGEVGILTGHAPMVTLLGTGTRARRRRAGVHGAGRIPAGGGQSGAGSDGAGEQDLDSKKINDELTVLCWSVN